MAQFVARAADHLGDANRAAPASIGEDWPLFNLSGVNALAMARDNAIWLGIDDGVLHWDRLDLWPCDTANSPLPASTGAGHRIAE